MSRCALVVSLLLVPGLAMAASWEQSFPPEAVKTYLPAEGEGILVAVTSPDARAAGQALSAALRSTGKVRLVMDDSALGNLAGQSDAQIAQQAAALPVEMVAVVRVFASPNGSTAVVNILDKKGTSLAAISAELGVALKPRAAEGSAQGLPTATAASVAAVTKNDSGPSDAAHEEYENQHLSLEDNQFVAVNQYGAVVAVGTTTSVFQGKYKRELRGGDIYLALGDQEALEKYKARSTAKVVLTAGGGGLMLAGLGVLIWTTVDAMGCKTTDPYGYGICDEKNGFDTVKLAVSISLFGVGMISMFTGLFLPRHTMDLPTLRLKVDEHNKQLKAKLGLASNEQSNDEEVATIWFSPFGAPNGGGLMIGGRL